MPRESKKTPPSQMIRVPTPLIEAVQKLSRLHRLGHKNAVLQGLKELISEIDSSSDIDFGASDEARSQLALMSVRRLIENCRGLFENCRRLIEKLLQTN